MKKIFFFLALISFVFNSCSKEDDTGELNNTINNFVWKAMNSWYNWQENVPNLNDIQDNDSQSYYAYLNNYSSPESLFQSLLFDAGNTDRFSWFIDNYLEQQKQFQGISLTTGIRRSVPIDIGDNQIIIYVQKVSLNSPAYNAGIRRGDIINAIDNEVMNEANYVNVINKLYSGQTIIVSTAQEDNGVLTKKNDFTISPVEVSDNPVHFTKIFNDINGKKVGYLVYNGFRSSYNDELNEVFSLFKSENITELILDLRINGGGSVLTSAYLASMIYENAGVNTFAELRFNSKHTNENGTYDFENSMNIFNADGEKTGSESINRLNTLNKVYVLTSGSTASASEMIINGLKPFIAVKTIGTTTYGKNVGSITLYDSPSTSYTGQSSANSNHFNALQPIVFQIYNKDGQSEYTQGFAPNIKIEEWRYWNEILPFGDENEVILKTALDDIRGLSARPIKLMLFSELKQSDLVKLDSKFPNEMYIESDFFQSN